MNVRIETPAPASVRPAVPNTSDSRDREPLVARLIIVVASLAAAAMLWTRRDYIPMWDGRIYSECVIDASRRLFDVGAYRCAGHISQSYVALLVLAQSLARSSPIPILAMNAALLALGAIALHRLLQRVFTGVEHHVGRALMMAAFLVHPIVLASAVQPGLDFGMLIFSMCTLAAAIEGRRWGVVLFGIMLVFSKEPGVLIYGVIAATALWREGWRRLLPNGAYWIGLFVLGALTVVNAVRLNLLSSVLFALLLYVLLARRERVTGVPLTGLVRAALAQWTLAIPLVLVFGYMGVHALGGARTAAAVPGVAAPIVWGGASAAMLVRTLLRSGIIDRSTITVLALMFVVGFLWLPALISLLDALVGAVRRRRLLPARPMPGVDTAAMGLLTAAFVGEVWLLSRFITYANARYYLPVYPLALVVAYAALVRLGVSRTFRSATFVVIAVLLGVSAVRTVDPVSRVVWGTFAVGEHPMLVITSLTGECCGAGRDQLVYNLEFTEFDALTSAALARLRPTSATTIVLPVLGDWYTVGQLDAATRRRTLRRVGVVSPRVVTAMEAYQRSAELPEAWYLELPYLDNSESLNRLHDMYEFGPPAVVQHGGYAMPIRRMRLRRGPLGRPASNGPTAATTGGSLP